MIFTGPSMRLRLVPTIALSSSLLVLGCPKKGGDAADAAADTAAAPTEDAASVPPASTGPAVLTASNSAVVARFPAETPVPDDDSKLAQTVQVHTSPRAGSVVATLKPGADVTKLATYEGSYLVSFPDPANASNTLGGWIVQDAFSAPSTPVVVAKGDAGVKTDAGAAVVDAGAKVDAGAAKLACATGQVPVVLSKDPVCKKKCTKDADCKTGGCANATGQGGGVFRVCASE